MNIDHKRLFDAVRAVKGSALTQADVDAINAALGNVPTSDATSDITPRVAAELLDHEAIVLEAYKDSVGVWTWGVGVTDASGHKVSGYKDNPQPIDKALDVYIWLLRERYAPAVRKAFAGYGLTEAQFAAALSFHYNTGAIGNAEWVKSWKAGKPAQARQEIMNWRSPASIIPRREKERDLFFDGKWSNTGKANVYPVRKPSYQPNFAAGKRVEIMPALEALL